jgi:hypothetical protein
LRERVSSRSWQHCARGLIWRRRRPQSALRSRLHWWQCWFAVNCKVKIHRTLSGLSTSVADAAASGTAVLDHRTPRCPGQLPTPQTTPARPIATALSRDAWSEALGAVGECVLLQQTVLVEMHVGLSTIRLSVGSLSACAVFVGVIVFWARRMKAELKDALVMLLTEASKTIISISFELGNLATDLLTIYRVVFEDVVRSPQYRVTYAMFGCLAIMAGLVSIVYLVLRAYRLRSQIKLNAVVEQEPAEANTGLEDGATHDIVRNLTWELEKASRDLKARAVGAMCLLLEDVPMVRANRPEERKT